MFKIRKNKLAIMFAIILVMTVLSFAQGKKERQLIKILGNFPTPRPLRVETLESVKFDTGWLHKIEYVAEQADPLFDRP